MQSEKHNVFSKFISVILSVIMAVSCLCIPVFAETTTYGDWVIYDDTAVYGDIGFTYHKNNTSDTWEYSSGGGKYYVKPSGTNGSVSNGIINTSYAYCDFTPAKDGTLVVYVGNASTKTGYVNKKADGGDMTLVGSFVPGGTDDYDTTGFTVTQGSSWAALEIEVETGYTYYIALHGSKMYCYGAEFTAYTSVTGKITDSFNLSGYGIRFTNKTTGETKDAEVSDGSYSVLLKPGYDYSAALTGDNANNYAFTSETRTVTVAVQDTQTADLTIEERVSYTASGSITGMTESYSLSDMKLTFTPNDTSSFETVNASIDTTNKTYSVQLAALENYTLSLSGAYDYEITSETSYYGSNSTALLRNIELTALTTYNVSGKFLGLTQTRGEYETLSVTPTAITFTNVDDKYVYVGTVSEGAYSVSLRNGSYLASITADGYSTSTHVVVNGADTERDLLLKADAAAAAYTDTLYVGSDRDYKTVQSAVDAVTNMGTRTSEQPVTIEIDPGTYREQVVINTPYVTLKGTGTSRDDTIITWYYGIGYNYYSCSDGYYSPYADYDKFEKSEPARWGTAVLTQSSATGFKAENITFENSFNKYMTDEEISDGVELSGSQTITTVRKESTNVETRAATERAAAYVNFADQTEFYNCSFIGSQDTLYTCNVAYDAYYRSCYIEGQTDFIYGNGDVIFDGCELNLCGYDGTEAAAYITANSCSQQYTAENGYIFRSCYISYSSERDTTASYLGRTWGDSAKVSFINTQLQESGMILDAGWSDMSGIKPTDSTVSLTEYNTTHNGTPVGTTNRVTGAVDTIDSSAYSVEKVFTANGWTPSYYVGDSSNVPEFTTGPQMTSNGDLNTPNPGETVTLSYALGDEWTDEDASRISWYAVSTDYDDTSLETILNSSTLLKAGSAVSGNTFQIPMDCAECYLMAVVTPITVSGLTGEAQYIINKAAVSTTWSDPSHPGSIAPGSGINIYLAGDSTVKDYSEKGIYNGGTVLSAGSWGEFLQEFFNEDYVTVNNYAQGGRSSRSFINEGKLDTIIDNIKEGDYLLIQFGHNDCANGASYYEERFAPLYTAANPPTSKSSGFPTIKPEENMKTTTPSALVSSYGDTYYAWDCGATYKGYIQEYIDRALEKNAIPVIVSPVARMYYSNGTIRTHHDATMTDYDGTLDYLTENNAYVTACKELYAENIEKGNNVLYIDAYEMTETLFNDAYAACGSDEYGKAIMDTGDSTHSNKTGGMIQAGLIAKWMKDAGISLSSYVTQPETVYGVETSGDYIFTIKDKIFTAKDKSLTEYPYWSNIGQEIFDYIGGSSSVVNIDLDFSTEDAVALYETNAATTYTDGVYSGRYTNDSSQTFDVSVYQNGVSYSEGRAEFGTKVTSSPVFSFTVSDAASYTVTFTPSTSYGESDIVGLYTDSSCSNAAATALVSAGSVTYNKTTSGEETLYFSTDSSNLYVKSFTISSEDLPVNEVTLAFNTDAALALYETNAATTFTDGSYSGTYTNGDGQTFDAAVYSAGIQYYSSQIKYGTKATAGKAIFSFTADKAGKYTVTSAIGTGTGNVNLYSDAACTTAVATAAAGSDLTYTKTSSDSETIYFASSDVSNLYLTEMTIAYEEINVVTLDFNTNEALALYETNAASTFANNNEYSGIYTNSDGTAFDVTVYSAANNYYSSQIRYGVKVNAKTPVFSFTADEKAMYTITTTIGTGSGTIAIYTDSACETDPIATGAAGESVIYKKQDSTAETLYVTASAVSNLYVATFSITKEELAEETKNTYTGSITGIETDDSNVQLTLKSSTDTVDVSADEYTSTGATLIDDDTYTVTAVGEKGVYTGSVTTDGTGKADIVLSRIEFAFPLDFVTNFDDYNTYLTAKGSSSDVKDGYSGITVHGNGVLLYSDYKQYGAKTNSKNIISFTAEKTGKITVNVGITASGKTADGVTTLDTLQLNVNDEVKSATIEVKQNTTASLTAYVTAGDTVTLYTPTCLNLYYSTIEVEYTEALKAIKTVNNGRYIIFGISDDDTEKSSSFNIIKDTQKTTDTDEGDISFTTVYKAVQFGDRTLTAEELLGEGVNYVIAFKLSDDDAETSDIEILDGFGLSFNY